MSDPIKLPAGVQDLRGEVFEDRVRIGDECVVGEDHVFFAGTTLDEGRPVLVQLFRPTLAHDRSRAQRLDKRVKATRRVKHEAVVCPIDSGQRFDGALYLLSARPPGVTLDEFLAEQTGGRVPWAVARPLLLDLVRGLAAIHKRRVVHGALHPRVCWVDAPVGTPPRLRVLGLGSNVDPTAREKDASASGTAPFSGDPCYVAPETVKGVLGDARADAYVVGLLAFFMLVGRPPFDEGSPFQILAAHLQEAPPRLASRVDELPPQVDALVAQLLAKEPEQRPASLLEVEQALVAIESEMVGPELLAGSSAAAAGFVRNDEVAISPAAAASPPSASIPSRGPSPMPGPSYGPSYDDGLPLLDPPPSAVPVGPEPPPASAPAPPPSPFFAPPPRPGSTPAVDEVRQTVALDALIEAPVSTPGPAATKATTVLPAQRGPAPIRRTEVADARPLATAPPRSGTELIDAGQVDAAVSGARPQARAPSNPEQVAAEGPTELIDVSTIDFDAPLPAAAPPTARQSSPTPPPAAAITPEPPPRAPVPAAAPAPPRSASIALWVALAILVAAAAGVGVGLMLGRG